MSHAHRPRAQVIFAVMLLLTALTVLAAPVLAFAFSVLPSLAVAASSFAHNIFSPLYALYVFCRTDTVSFFALAFAPLVSAWSLVLFFFLRPAGVEPHPRNVKIPAIPMAGISMLLVYMP